MTVTLNLKPEVETGLLAQARATGMTLEAYLQQLVEREISVEAAGTGRSEGSGMIVENGLLVYRTGRPLPAHTVDEAIQRSREDRTKAILGNVS